MPHVARQRLVTGGHRTRGPSRSSGHQFVSRRAALRRIVAVLATPKRRGATLVAPSSRGSVGCGLLRTPVGRERPSAPANSAWRTAATHAPPERVKVKWRGEPPPEAWNQAVAVVDTRWEEAHRPGAPMRRELLQGRRGSRPVEIKGGLSGGSAFFLTANVCVEVRPLMTQLASSSPRRLYCSCAGWSRARRADTARRRRFAASACMPRRRRVPPRRPSHVRARRRRTRSSPTRRVTPSASRRSRRSCAGRRPVPRRSRKWASVIDPARSHSSTTSRFASS